MRAMTWQIEFATKAAELKDYLDGNLCVVREPTDQEIHLYMTQFEELCRSREILDALLNKLPVFSPRFFGDVRWQCSLPRWIEIFEQILFLDKKSLIQDNIHFSVSSLFTPFISYFWKQLTAYDTLFTSDSRKHLSEQVLSFLIEEFRIPIQMHQSLIDACREKTMELSGTDRWLHFGKKAPAALKQACLRIDALAAGISKALSRLTHDKIYIENFLKCPLTLTKVILSGADLHNNNQQVLIFEFNHVQKIIYKPRAMECYKAFFEFIHAFNLLQTTVQLREIWVHCGESEYGWMEFIEDTPITSSQELALNAGAMTALVHLLCANDMHNTNVIASGNHLIPIDLETIVLPYRPPSYEQTLAEELFSESLFSTHLLPFWMTSAEDIHGIEFGGLSKSIFSKLSPNDQRVFFDAIISTYEFIIKNQDLLPWHVFLGGKIRYVHRPTQTYHKLLRCTTDKREVESGLMRSLRLYALYALDHLIPNHQDKHFAIFKSEMEQMERGDIPYFQTRCDSLDLTIDPTTIVCGYFQKNGLTHCSERRQKVLLPSFLHFNIKLLMSSFEHMKESTLPQITLMNTNLPLDLEMTWGLIEQIEKALLDTAHAKIDSLSWVTSRYISQNSFMVTPAHFDFYEGVSGIAMFFAALHHAAPSEARKQHVYETLNPLLNAIHTHSLGYHRPGKSFFLNGMAGIALGLMRCGMLMKDQTLVQEALEIASNASLSKDTSNNCVLDGVAGGLMVLIELYHWSKSPLLLEKITQWSDYLLSQRVINSHGLRSWHTINQKWCHTGYAYGAAGIAHALIESWHITHNDAYLEAALEGLKWEDTYWNNEQENWWDLYDANNPSTDILGWCRGFSGSIGARHHIEKHLTTINWPASKERLMHKLLTQHNFNCDDCCCGFGGLLDICWSIAHSSQRDPTFFDATQLKASEWVQTMNQRGKWQLKHNAVISTLGLLHGITGIGYLLLRFIDPDLPSALQFSHEQTQRFKEKSYPLQ